MCSKDEWTCATGQCIPQVRHGDSIFDCTDHSDEGPYSVSCKNASMYDIGYIRKEASCPNDFKCRPHVDFDVCLPFSSVCDGVAECPYNDDEALCTPGNCPDGCTCTGLNFKCNFNVDTLKSFPIKTRSLDFSYRKVDLSAFPHSYFPLLVHLNLSHSAVESLPEANTLAVSLGCENLQIFDLRFNNITFLPSRRFQRMFRLRHLYLEGNPIHTIEDFAFADLLNMRSLSLPNAFLLGVSKFALHGLENLVFLNFSNNQISWMDDMVFSTTVLLVSIDLSHNLHGCYR